VIERELRMSDVKVGEAVAARDGGEARFGPALVTGAGRGIGRAIAVALGRHGGAVCLVARSAGDLEATAELVRAAGGEAHCLTCDVTDERQSSGLVDAAVERLGGLALLVNNAGGARRVGELQELELRDIERGTDLNYLSSMRLMHHAAAHLFAAAPDAAVVNIVSIAALRGLEGMGYYSAAKAAVVGLTRATAREWGPRGVRVNALAPGWIATDLSEPLRRQDEFSSSTLSQIPLGRWGQPDDVADAVLFLASRRARYITGECLTVDGGLLA
jgi:NAD(P)-dependent dehydrogenase (short-subunit alcohol dehydrogenase family)